MAVVGLWDDSGKLRAPVTLKPYGLNMLVGDRVAGVYRVALDNLPSLRGFKCTPAPPSGWMSCPVQLFQTVRMVGHARQMSY